MNSVFYSVTMKSPGVSLTLSALFTLENLPEHKLSFQQLNCRAVLKELNYIEKLLLECRHCSLCLLLSYITSKPW